ncbi:methyl-accepting chemotaxis protein [Microvirgula aerodenitrificans]|uniref:methyl-accepting chemotaxis protein n=1 Tax=Microvirgula aerodenitrificans TaxID=57480 RepID=UPI000A071314|nr:HAMP domain-containing methyl-accepting chemotaxis protein [Microvirgula aerodenitrificans]
MKISTKLYGMALISLVGLVAMLWTLYVQMGMVEVHVSEATENALPSIIATQEAKGRYLEARRQGVIHAASQDMAGKKDAQAAMQDNLAKLYKDLDNYKATLISNDEDRANTEATIAAVKKWEGLLPGFFALSDKGTADGNNAALQYIKSTMSPVALEAYAAIDKMVEFNKTLGVQAGSEAVQAGRNAKWVLMTLGLVLLAVITGASLWVAMSVRRTLGNLDHKIAAITSERNLTLRVDDSGKDEIALIANRLNQLLQMLQTSFVELTQIGQSVGGHASEVANSSVQMSQAVEQVSESTSSMSAAVEQMTVSVNHVADRSVQADQSGRAAGEEATIGAAVIRDTIQMIRQTSDSVKLAAGQIEQLKEKTTSIGTVVGVIKDIAEQTNLLALNAAIEAARAGETGRGFAVVADEVRKLAERTAISTQEITSTVSSMQSDANQTVTSMQNVVTQVENGMESANQATEAINRILERTSGAVDEIAEISHSMREQSLASTSIAQQIERVAQMAEESHSSSQSNSATAANLNEQAQRMLTTIGQFRV